MYEKIYNECPKVKRIFSKETKHVPYYLLGSEIPHLEEKEMICLLRISGDYISRMYKKAISNRVGVG